MRRAYALALLPSLLLVACGGPAPPDGGDLDAGGADAGDLDAGGADAGGSDAGSDAGSPPPCAAFLAAESLGEVGPTELNEISGLAFSRIEEGRLYVHNDSGDEARFFALSLAGEGLAEVRLPGASARDWEDMAAGPGPEAGRAYLYLGDIGDNNARTGAGAPRGSIFVHRTPEPELPAGGGMVTVDAAEWETFELRYEDAPHDAEALMIEPSTGDLYLLTKEDAPSSTLYVARAPLSSAAPNTLTRLATFAFGALVTAADIAPDGRRILARNYSRAFLWIRAPGQSVEEAMVAPPMILPLTPEPQGEAIAFRASGSGPGSATGFGTISEGAHPPIYLYGEACP